MATLIFRMSCETMLFTIAITVVNEQLTVLIVALYVVGMLAAMAGGK